MAFEITDWNLNPNQNWFIKIEDAGTNITVSLYETEADSIAGTNIIATATDIAFGTDVEVVLVPTVEGSISYFNEGLSFHLKVSGGDSDVAKTFQLSPFIDLPDISNSVYSSNALIQERATYEINAHTHVTIKRDIEIANHIPTMNVGDICRINSTLRDIDVLTTIEEMSIIGTQDSLINQIETVEYTDLNYN